MRNWVAEMHKNEPGTQGRYDLMSESEAKETNKAVGTSVPRPAVARLAAAESAAGEIGSAEATAVAAAIAAAVVVVIVVAGLRI
jgi:hypothetical protein